ncbi:hypothetical protein [Salinimicrobium oceani]|uniref:hypothetical protein n=1 Tax=Salinimicrobium oceani TaxID=2722702 RepID=UPI001F472A99|nr:hypothetical protein [Salinimicrobium oceani]
MFKKVLVAEDIDSINLAVGAVLEKLAVDKVEHAEYCDKAWLLAKKSHSGTGSFSVAHL